MRLGAVGLKLARALEVRHGLLGPALLHVSSSRSLERIGQSWIDLKHFAKHFERVGGISLLKIQYPECFPVTCPGKLPFPRSGSKPSSITSTTAANSLATPATLQSAAISTEDSARSNRLPASRALLIFKNSQTLLRQVGYAEPNVEGVMHANWIRFFRKALGPPDNPS